MLDFWQMLGEHLGTICLVTLSALIGVAALCHHTEKREKCDPSDQRRLIPEGEIRAVMLTLALTNGKGVRTCGTSPGCSSDSRWLS